MSSLMNAAVLKAYGQFEWQGINIPKIQPDEVLLRVGYAGICGSDQHIFSGDFHPRTPVPFVPGHEFAGTIVEVGNAVTKYVPGDRVAVDPIIPCGECAACSVGHVSACISLKLLGVDLNGGFGEYVVAKEHMLFKLTDNISDKHAALVEVYSIGFHANNRAQTRADDTIAIWGAGRVGQVILQAARTKTDNTIFAIDILDKRLEIAQTSMPNVIPINSKKENPIEVVFDHTEGKGVDVAFEAVGHEIPVPERPHPVRGCIQSIHGGGTVCVLGLADDPAPLVMKELIWKEAKIVASRVSHGEFAESIQHLDAGNLNPNALISAEYHASHIQEAFEILEKEPENYLKILLRM